MSSRPQLAAETLDRDQPCDLCRGRRWRVVCRRDRCGNELSSVVCVRCGLVSHLRIPSDEELREYYARTYRRDYHGEVAPSARRVIRAWSVARGLFRQLRPHLRADDRVFEIGAGIGCTVKVLQLAGYEATGIEPGRGFGEFSRRRLHAEIENVGLAGVSRRPSYDFVLLIHVIEHFNSPAAALRHIHAILNPGGRLYVECPNIGAPHSAPGKLFHFAHVYNFTHRTLAMLADVCGFRVGQRFSTHRDRNVKILLERADHGRIRIDPHSYAETMAALTRYNTLTYHLRPRYWADRARTVFEHLRQRLWCRRRLESILDLCARHERSRGAAAVIDMPSEGPRRRRAA